MTLDPWNPDPLLFLSHFFEALLPAAEHSPAPIGRTILGDLGFALHGSPRRHEIIARSQDLSMMTNRPRVSVNPATDGMVEITREDVSALVDLALWRFRDELPSVEFDLWPREATGAWLRAALNGLRRARFSREQAPDREGQSPSRGMKNAHADVTQRVLDAIKRLLGKGESILTLTRKRIAEEAGLSESTVGDATQLDQATGARVRILDTILSQREQLTGSRRPRRGAVQNSASIDRTATKKAASGESAWPVKGRS